MDELKNKINQLEKRHKESISNGEFNEQELSGIKTQLKLLKDLHAIIVFNKNQSYFRKETEVLIDILNCCLDAKHELFIDRNWLSCVKLEIWKFYRAYKLKEFIYLFAGRINAEKGKVDKNNFKTVDMIDEAFCWHITNTGNNSDKKYNQRFYSEDVFQKKIKKEDIESTSKLSNSERTMLLRAVLNKDEMLIDQSDICTVNYLKYIVSEKDDSGKKTAERKIGYNEDQTAEFITRNFTEETTTKKVEIITKSTYNDPWNIFFLQKFYDAWNILFPDQDEISIADVIASAKCKEDVQNFIHSVAEYPGKGIQLDHVLQRESIKSIVEDLCNSVDGKNDNDKEELIKNTVDFLLPLMFGCVVTKEENSALNKVSIDLANCYYNQLDNNNKKKLWDDFVDKEKIKNPDENEFCNHFKHFNNGKAARKAIAKKLLFQYWNSGEDDKEKRMKILNMLYQNYVFATDTKDEKKCTAIKLYEIFEVSKGEVEPKEIKNFGVLNTEIIDKPPYERFKSSC